MKPEIIETSLQQFLTHGIRKMTVKEIIAPLGISTKTVYKYFANKEALLEECLVLHYSRLHSGLADTAVQYSNPVILLFQAFIKGIELDFKVNDVFYHDLNYYYPELQDKIIQQNSAKLGEPLIKAFNDGIAEGYIRSSLSAEVFFEGIGALYSSLTRTSRFHKFGLSPFELAANTIEVYLRGLCTQKGLKEIDDNPKLTSFNYKP